MDRPQQIFMDKTKRVLLGNRKWILVELLNTRGIEYKKTNNPTEILVSCTSGEHTDKSPVYLIILKKIFFIVGVVVSVVE